MKHRDYPLNALLKLRAYVKETNAQTFKEVHERLDEALATRRELQERLGRLARRKGELHEHLLVTSRPVSEHGRSIHDYASNVKSLNDHMRSLEKDLQAQDSIIREINIQLERHREDLRDSLRDERVVELHKTKWNQERRRTEKRDEAKRLDEHSSGRDTR
ncbi:hypothetical protein JW905_18885 [bacterium]|nr:hypothetical protein [candidate division CSSED10-310 bacterium]